MIKGRLDSRFPDFQSHAHPPSLPRWGLSQKFPRPPWPWRDLSVLQTLPYFYTGFSELCVIARGYRSEFLSHGSVLRAGHKPGHKPGQACPGLSGTGEGGFSKSVPCCFLTCLQKTGFLLDTSRQKQNVSQKGPWFNISGDGQAHIIQLVTYHWFTALYKTGIFLKEGKEAAA